MPERIYISGPMRGYDAYNFPAFFAAEETILAGLGPDTVIFNPARKDVDEYDLGLHLREDPTGETAGWWLINHPQEFDLRRALTEDIDWVLNHATAVVVLPGWEKSNGAMAEVAAARAVGTPVLRLDESLPAPVHEPDHDPAVEGWQQAFSVREHPGPTLADDDWQHSAEQTWGGDPLRSGEEVRLTSATGGEKGTKLAAFDQISPEIERLVAEHFGKGARKYAAHNFRNGYAWSLSYSALRRHLADFWSGKEYDTCPEDGVGCKHTDRDGNPFVSEPGTCYNHTGSLHIVAVIWHAMVLTEFFLHRKEYDDRYVYTPEG